MLSPQAVCGVTRVRDEMHEPIFSLLIPPVLLVNCSLTSREVFHGSEGGLGYRIQSLRWEWLLCHS